MGRVAHEGGGGELKVASSELEAPRQHLKSHIESEEGSNDESGAKSEELEVNNPMSSTNLMTKVC